MSDNCNRVSETCRFCLSPDPRTIHGEFICGFCLTCSEIIERRMRKHRETPEEAIEYFEETNVRPIVIELRAEHEGRSIPATGGGS